MGGADSASLLSWQTERALGFVDFKLDSVLCSLSRGRIKWGLPGKKNPNKYFSEGGFSSVQKQKKGNKFFDQTESKLI